MIIRHKKLNRTSALYAILFDLLADLTSVTAGVVDLDTEYDKNLVDVAAIRDEFLLALDDVIAIRDEVLLMIDDEDAFRTTYDALATLKEVVSLGSPETHDVDQVVTSEDIPAQSATLTIAANPDTPRNLVFTAVEGGVLDALFTAVGTDQFGDAVTETFAVDSATPVVGVKVFAAVTSITATTVTTDTGVNTIEVGAGSVLGLPVQITQVADCMIGLVAEVSEAVVAEATYHSVTMTTAPDGTARKVVITRDSVGAAAKTASDPGAITASDPAAISAGAASLGAVASTAPEVKTSDPSEP